MIDESGDAGERADDGTAAVSGWCRGCSDALLGDDGVARCPRCGERLHFMPRPAMSRLPGPRPPPYGGASDAACCRRCLRSPPGFDATIVLGDYAPPLDRLVHAMKYGRRAALGRALGHLLAHRIGMALPLQLRLAPSVPQRSERGTHEHAPHGRDAHSWIVCPVPLAPRRLAERGFNQSLLMAAPVSRALGLSLHPTLLVRKATGSAAAIPTAGERRRLLRNAFAVNDPAACRDRSVLVVDDVMTSGATLRAVAHTLKAAGAAQVINLVAARTATMQRVGAHGNGGGGKAQEQEQEQEQERERGPC